MAVVSRYVPSGKESTGCAWLSNGGMMEGMAKRRKGLGSSAAEHNTRAVKSESWAQDEAREAFNAAKAGKCTRALGSLLLANKHLGTAVSERRGAADSPEHMHQPHDTAALVSHAETAYRRYCTVKA